MLKKLIYSFGKFHHCRLIIRTTIFTIVWLATIEYVFCERIRSVPCVANNRLQPRYDGTNASTKSKQFQKQTIEFANELQREFERITSASIGYQRSRKPIKGICAANYHAARSADENRNSASAPLLVNVSVETYRHLSTVNQITSEYTINYDLDLEWCDERLIISNPSGIAEPLDDSGWSRYRIEGGEHQLERIWIPTIVVANDCNANDEDNDDNDQDTNEDGAENDAENRKSKTIFGNAIIRIDLNTGRVWMRQRKLMRIHCPLESRNAFPFDRPRCSAQLASNVEHRQALMLSCDDGHRNRTFENIEPHQTPSSSSSAEAIDNYSRCTIELAITDSPPDHVIMLNELFFTYGPNTVIVATSWASFWLGANQAVARTLLGVNTMLALALAAFRRRRTAWSRARQPTIWAHMHILDIWNLICALFIALSILELVIVHRLHSLAARQAAKMSIIDNRKKRCMITTSLSTINNGKDQNNNNNNNWNNNNNRNRLNANKLYRVPGETGATAAGFAFASETGGAGSFGPKTFGTNFDISRVRHIWSRSIGCLKRSWTLEGCEIWAINIDRICRRAFPITFVTFNIVYWAVVLSYAGKDGDI